MPRKLRAYLTEAEVTQLMAAAEKRGRYGHRDATAILLAYRHGLRVSELCALTWDRVQWRTHALRVARAMAGKPATHPLTGTELRQLRQLRQDWPDSRHLFVTERGAPMTPTGFAKMLSRAAAAAGFAFAVHPQMLRHSCGYKLAQDGHDPRTIQAYLGHRQLQSTVRYTPPAGGRFVGLWPN
jgi:site-specific recombinase XerD